MTKTQLETPTGTREEFAVPPVYTVKQSDTAFDDVFANAANHPEDVAARRLQDDGHWTSVTCAELATEVEALAAGLVAAQIEAGERVALLSRTRYEWMIADFAIMSIGAVTVPIYETSSAEQVEWILADSGAAAVIVENDSHAEEIRRLLDRLPALRDIWTIGDFARLATDGLQVGSDRLSERRQRVRAADLATIVYSSGTTGRPKGCMLTHANLVATVRNVTGDPTVHELLFNQRQSTLLFLPLAHILARLIECGAIRTRVQLGHLADMKAVSAGLQSFQPSLVLSVPRVFEKIYNTAQHSAGGRMSRRIFAGADRVAREFSRALDEAQPNRLLRLEHKVCDTVVFRRLRSAMGGHVEWAVSGGAPLGAGLGHFFRGVGVNVLEGYGLTETTAGGTFNLPGSQRIGSVGRPIPGCTIKIAADGEILMRGPHVFIGYWANPEATAAAFDADGWFRTGDIGHLDADGYLYITDRKKDIIVTAAGKNVAPTVLEDRLRAHWLISQAAVFGDRRPYIAALLTLDGEALQSWKRERGKPPELSNERLARDADLLREVQAAVDDANAAVSQAEAIKRWLVLANDFTETGGELTPTMKLKRNVIAEQYAHEVESLYAHQAT